MTYALKLIAGYYLLCKLFIVCQVHSLINSYKYQQSHVFSFTVYFPVVKNMKISNEI